MDVGFNGRDRGCSERLMRVTSGRHRPRENEDHSTAEYCTNVSYLRQVTLDDKRPKKTPLEAIASSGRAPARKKIDGPRRETSLPHVPPTAFDRQHLHGLQFTPSCFPSRRAVVPRRFCSDVWRGVVLLRLAGRLPTVALMTFSQFGLYLTFAIGCLLGYIAWMQFLARLRRHRISPRSLNDHQRQTWEQLAVDSLQQRCRQDPTACRQFLTHCLTSVSQPGEMLHVRTASQPDWIRRLLAASVHQLSDPQLRRLTALLSSSPASPTMDANRLRPRPAGQPRRMAIVISGLIGLLLILGFPPWIIQINRHTQIIGGSRTMETREQSSVGYHWVGDRRIPPARVTYRRTDELRRLQHDEQIWRVDYSRLALQLIVVTLASSSSGWLPRKPGRCPPRPNSNPNWRWGWQ